MRCLNSSFAALVCAAVALVAEPLRLHPDNPRYFLFGGKPAVLITSGEHYGAVLNRAFDYRRYLDTLAEDNLNLTRVFTGLYREVPGSFGILRNTLAPEEKDFVQPFRRIGPQRYDLEHWNDEYFSRFRDFVQHAGKLGIVVEVTLFTTYYNDTHWSLSALNAKNNVQGIGRVASTEVLTMKEADLVSVQERFVRKLVNELRAFDNVYYEVCNEPYFHGVTPEWQRHITRVVADTESPSGPRHLISLNVANGQALVQEPDPNVSIFNFHYARPPVTVGMNYALAKPIGNNETGFDGTADFVYRIQGWDFLMAGGALYNNLDYSFAVGFEDGSFPVPGDQPGGGSPAFRRQLKVLRTFFDSIPYVQMKPNPALIAGGVPDDGSALTLAGKGTVGLYLHHGKVLEGYQPRYVVATRKRTVQLQLAIPQGDYQVQWWDPKSGPLQSVQQLSHAGGILTLAIPEYSHDIAVTMTSR